MSVTVLLRDGSGNNTIRLSSVNTKIVAGVNDRPGGELSIDGEPLGTGYKFTAVDRIVDEDGRGPMRYQWFVNGSPVAGADDSVFVLEHIFGEIVDLRATYTDALGQVHSVGTTGSPFQPDMPATLGIAGTVAPGAILRANASDPDGIETIHYAWDMMDSDGSWAPVAAATNQELRIGATAPAAVRLFIDLADARGATSEKVIVLGTDDADTIRFDVSGESVHAAGGDDVILSGNGTQLVDGGAGFDTYVSTQAFHIFRQADGEPGEWSVLRNDFSVTGFLTNVERVLLNQHGVALDIDGHGGQAFRLYEAAFDRSADMVGLGFWISRLDQGVKLRTIADAFVASPEFKAMYGASPTNAAIVAKFYANILDREPDATGVAFWNHALDTGTVTVADVLIAFSESDENVAALVGVTENGIRYTPYAGN